MKSLYLASALSVLVAITLSVAAPALSEPYRPSDAKFGGKTTARLSENSNAAAYRWAGLYIGGNVGYGWGKSKTDTTLFNGLSDASVNFIPVSFFTARHESSAMNNWLGGAQIGYNWQKDNWVYGLEVDYQRTKQKGNPAAWSCPATVCGPTGNPIDGPIDVSFRQTLKWFSTVRTRLGFAITPTVLAYATGGLALGVVDSRSVITGVTGGGVIKTAGIVGSDKIRAGWTLGGGVETYLSGNWTAKIEYIYLDLGSNSFTNHLHANYIPVRANISSDMIDHIVRVGLNYRINGN